MFSLVDNSMQIIVPMDACLDLIAISSSIADMDTDLDRFG